jgi:peptide-methionine (S)-S-oxide reductase
MLHNTRKRHNFSFHFYLTKLFIARLNLFASYSTLEKLYASHSTEPTYNQVCAGMTGHTEAVNVYFDPKECTYEQLLDTFFTRVNPTTVNGQGNDFGKQYRTGVYPHTPEHMEIAQKRFEEEKKKYNRPIATELKDAMPFWPAEKYHQQYLEKGGRGGQGQDASKGATATIRCYG